MGDRVHVRLAVTDAAEALQQGTRYVAVNESTATDMNH